MKIIDWIPIDFSPQYQSKMQISMLKTPLFINEYHVSK
jgi:hypothetical protein